MCETRQILTWYMFIILYEIDSIITSKFDLRVCTIYFFFFDERPCSNWWNDLSPRVIGFWLGCDGSTMWTCRTVYLTPGKWFDPSCTSIIYINRAPVKPGIRSLVKSWKVAFKPFAYQQDCSSNLHYGLNIFHLIRGLLKNYMAILLGTNLLNYYVRFDDFLRITASYLGQKYFSRQILKNLLRKY